MSKAASLHAVFSDLDGRELKVLMTCFKQRILKPDEVIIKAEEIRRELFFIQEGTIVSTLKLPGSIERKRGHYHEGDFFNEISFFAQKPSFDTFYAAEETTLLSLSEDAFLELMEKNSVISTKFTSRLMAMTVKRFRATSKFLADVVQWGEGASRRVITDELTGAYNRAFLDDALEDFFNTSVSNNKPLSLFMIDIDNFNTVNEQVGRDAGDAIILEVVKILKDAVSSYGILARYGGDEFSILLPEADLEKAKTIAEVIRFSLEELDFSKYLKGSKIKITASIGISNYPETAVNLESFKKNADASLYRAKDRGRNRIEALKD